MEYSDLVQAIQENDSSRVDDLMKSLYPRLIHFLRIHMNASGPDAEDCAQESLLTCLEMIEKNNLKKPERVLTYLLKICRNNYLDMSKPTREQAYEEIPEGQYHRPGQLVHLLDKEKNQILKWCLDQLESEYRKFMEFWFQHPGFGAEAVADHFGISVSNAWTRKHRLIKQLNQCYEKKSKL